MWAATGRWRGEPAAERPRPGDLEDTMKYALLLYAS
jgi:hypothetical protein